MVKTEKTGKKIMQLKWQNTKKPKDKNMGWTKQLCTFYKGKYSDHNELKIKLKIDFKICSLSTSIYLSTV